MKRRLQSSKAAAILSFRSWWDNALQAAHVKCLPATTLILFQYICTLIMWNQVYLHICHLEGGNPSKYSGSQLPTQVIALCRGLRASPRIPRWSYRIATRHRHLPLIDKVKYYGWISSFQNKSLPSTQGCQVTVTMGGSHPAFQRHALVWCTEFIM